MDALQVPRVQRELRKGFMEEFGVNEWMDEQSDLTTIIIVTIEATWIDVLQHIQEVNTSSLREKKTNASRMTHLRQTW